MKQMMNPKLMLAVSMAVFGTLGLLVRNISVSSGELALYRAILAALLLLLYLAAKKQWICFGMSTLGIALITGIGDVSAGSNHPLGCLLILGFTMWNEISPGQTSKGS